MFYHFLCLALSVFKPRRALLLENLILRQQLAVLERSVRRPRLSPIDRLFWILLLRYSSRWRALLRIVLMAPQLADGVLVGVGLTVMMFLAGTMKPRSEVLGRTVHGTLAGAVTHDLAPISENYVALRFDASLVLINAAYFEQAVLKELAQFPNACALLVVGNGINRIDATGEATLRVLIKDLRAAGVTLMLAGLKEQVREALHRAGLIDEIGADNIFVSKDIAVRMLDERFAGRAATNAV